MRRQQYKKNADKIREASRRWRKKNVERVRERKRQWRRKNIEKVREQARQWYRQNSDKVCQWSYRWHSQNQDKTREARRRWYLQNRERVLEKNRQWAAQHLERARELHHQWYRAHWGEVRAKEWLKRPLKNIQFKEWYGRIAMLVRILHRLNPELVAAAGLDDQGLTPVERHRRRMRLVRFMWTVVPDAMREIGFKPPRKRYDDKSETPHNQGGYPCGNMRK
jgi:hypothetical protein